MSNLIRPAVVEFWTLAKNTISLDPSKNYQWRSAKAARIDWRTLIQAWQTYQLVGGTAPAIALQPPFTVLDIGAHTRNQDYSIDLDCRDLPFSFFICDTLSNEVLEGLEEHAEAFRNALLNPTGFTSFQIVEPPQIDSSPSNPANAVFLASNYPLLSVMVSGTMLVQQTFPAAS